MITAKMAGKTMRSTANVHEIFSPIIARCGAMRPPRNP